MENPYAPPPAEDLPKTEEQAEPDLARATKYLRRMGYLSMTYFGVSACAISADLNTRSSFNPDVEILVLVWSVSMLVVVTYFTMLASELSDKPRANMRQCRLFAIILATFFFPFLTLPALYVINQLRKLELSGLTKNLGTKKF